MIPSKPLTNKLAKRAYIRLVNDIALGLFPLTDFSNTTYVNKRTPMNVSCVLHGAYTVTSGNLRIHKNAGCPTCGNISMRAMKTSSISELQSKLAENITIIGEYNKAKEHIAVRCLCGYTWSATPKNLVAGHGCPSCSPGGFDRTKPAILYYLSIKNGEAYKIGITNRSVSERYSSEELLDITLLKEWHFDIGQDAYNLEQTIIQEYKEFKYNGKKLLKSGHTEMFFTNVLNLHTKETT